MANIYKLAQPLRVGSLASNPADSDSGIIYWNSATSELRFRDASAFVAIADLAKLASLATGKGASLIGIEDFGEKFSATTVEGALAEIAGTITSDFSDSAFRVHDNADATRKMAFEVSTIAASTTRTVTMPDADVNLTDVNNAILKGGSRAFTGDQSMGGFKLTTMANGTNAGDAVNKTQLDTKADDSTVIKKSGAVAFTGAQSMGSFKLTTMANGTDAGDAVNKSQLDTKADDSAVIKKNGTVAFTGSQSMGSNKITSLSAGTDPNDAVNKTQLDAKANDNIVLKKDGSVGLTANWDLSAGSFTIKAPAPLAAADVTTKSYVDNLVVSGGTVKEAALDSHQLNNAQGILASTLAYFTAIPSVDETFVIKSSLGTETWTFKASRSGAFEVTIGASAQAAMANLASAISADSAYWSAHYAVGRFVEVNPVDGCMHIQEQTTASGASSSRMYGSASNAYVVDYHLDTQYTTTGKTGAVLPGSDPTTSQFGFRRQAAALIDGEIHLAIEDLEQWLWNDTDSLWVLLNSSSSIPDADRTTRGLVTIGDGLDVSSGLISVGLVTSNPGLQLTGTAGSKDLSFHAKTNGGLNIDGANGVEVKLGTNLGLVNTSGSLQVDYDNSTIGIVSNKLAVKAGGIANNEIAAGAAIVYSKLSLGLSIVNADIATAAAIAYSKLNLATSIVNADISNSAAIAYSKLSLATSIVNGDISNSAAIAYSKLNLALAIVNGDISTSAAIAYSKLNLATSIVNADISNSAAIAYSKLALSNSIVSGDISATAAIAYSKLAALTVSRALQTNASTGFIEVSTVTNTELGYLSGVTNPIQTQLSSKISNVADDTDPQLGGHLDLNGKSLTGLFHLAAGASPTRYIEEEYIDAITLTGATTSVCNSLTFDTTTKKALKVDYTIVSGDNRRHGTLHIVADKPASSAAVAVSIVDNFTETADVGVVWAAAMNGNDCELSYTTSAGNKTMRASCRRWLA